MQPFAPTAYPIGGPGSQPVDEDGAELSYLSMPKDMQIYTPPSLPEPEAASGCPQGVRLLERLLAQLRSYRVLEPSRVLDLLELPEADRQLVAQALGEGEVSILFSADAILRAQETRLAGIWRVQRSGELGQLLSDELEVAEIPSRVRDLAFKDAAAEVRCDGAVPEGVLTGRSILTELNERTAAWRFGDLPHVVNLTLLPHVPDDLDYLTAKLGLGPVTILSRGYGSCRISATGLRNCWWVQHFNSDDKLILNSLEVVDVPSAALAAQEDIEDSADRLAEILDAVR
ncbi:hydrogenase expression/formation protein [Thiorhodococcus mannitoliphagus]|uniref:Hydrogenase expression/formation protein n=1 Tax=Thiorhodococcus mannitoliphagus TaxID=329406 RepID=A0A6P1DWR2_9GAMM|nr:hydrogenase expression/formation protein [Thiorhodococcus mannitoliphagus]NEX21890.1 hydrogenase expression/formation protein [Thiorhodococcus mannitoliphagus]